MPNSATSTDASISTYSVPCDRWLRRGRGRLGVLGDHRLENCAKRSLPPSDSGQPIHPPTIESTARIISGTVIDAGDSWMWCSTSCDTCDSPKNVMFTRRNM